MQKQSANGCNGNVVDKGRGLALGRPSENRVVFRIDDAKWRYQRDWSAEPEQVQRAVQEADATGVREKENEREKKRRREWWWRRRRRSWWQRMLAERVMMGKGTGNCGSRGGVIGEVQRS